MAQYKLLRKNRQLPPTTDPCRCYQNDHVDLVVEGAGIRLSRLSSLSVPAEVSAYIPRVEIRQRRYENGELVSEDERIYNSITVVHAPRHPPENPAFPVPPWKPSPLLPLPGGHPYGPDPRPNGPPPGWHTPPPHQWGPPTPAPQPTPPAEPPPPGEQPPPPEVPSAPGPDQPGAAEPPEIPSQPEPHPPPVSPTEPRPWPAAPCFRRGLRKEGPVITINQRLV